MVRQPDWSLHIGSVVETALPKCRTCTGGGVAMWSAAQRVLTHVAAKEADIKQIHIYRSRCVCLCIVELLWLKTSRTVPCIHRWHGHFTRQSALEQVLMLRRECTLNRRRESYALQHGSGLRCSCLTNVKKTTSLARQLFQTFQKSARTFCCSHSKSSTSPFTATPKDDTVKELIA